MPRRQRRGRPVVRDLRPLAFDQPSETQPSLPQRRDPDAAQHLENLRAALDEAAPDLFAKLERPTGFPPRLRITSREHGGLSELVHHRADRHPDGSGHYVWSWGQVLHSADEPGDAVPGVLRVLESLGRRS